MPPIPETGHTAEALSPSGARETPATERSEDVIDGVDHDGAVWQLGRARAKPEQRA